MDSLQARQLDRQLNPRQRRDVSGVVPMAPEARQVLQREGRGRATNDALLRAFQKDELAWDPKGRQLIPTETHVAIDETIRPQDKSPTFDFGVEECMEFVMRYFREAMAKNGRPDGSFGTDFPYQYNIADEVRQMAAGKLKKDGYTAYLNNGTVPPRAGDVLSLESAPDGSGQEAAEFHVALVTDVQHRADGWYVQVFQANVPEGVNDPDIKKHYEWHKMTVQNGKFSIARANTTRQGYRTDMDVVGWIHPTGQKALPGAVAQAAAPKAAQAAQIRPLASRVIGVA